MLEKVSLWGLMLLVASLIAGGLYAVFMSVKSDGEIVYCYVEVVSHEQLPPAYKLWGFRSWRTDRLIGAYLTQEETLKAADAMKCSINGRAR